MHVLVLGATGPSGVAFVEEALRAGHQVTIYARNPSKLPENVTKDSNVEIVKGDFDDLDAVRTAVAKGAGTLVSFAGPGVGSKGTPVTDFYQKLFPLLTEASSIRRCMILTTPSFKVPEDRWSLKWWLLVWLVKLMGGSAYDEVTGIGRIVTARSLDEVEWTLFRVPLLTNGEAQPVCASMVGDGRDGMLLSRKSIAVWVLQELKEGRWIGKAPHLSNSGWL